MKPSRRRIVIFGATGEIGGRIARDCVAAGHTVIGISRGRNTRSMPSLAGVEMLQGDRTDERFLKDTVAHINFDTLIDTVPTTESLLRYAHFFEGIRNVFLCSSTGTYVPLSSFPADEEHPWRDDTGVNFHRQSQRDAVALDLWRDERFPVTIFRPTNIVGRDRVPLELWGGRNIEFFRRLKSHEPVAIPDCQKVLIQSGYNDDLAGAFVSALEVEEAVHGETFIISSRRAITIGRYLETAMEFLGSCSSINTVSNEELMESIPSITWKHGLEFLLEPMCFDISKAIETFGYRPRKTTEDGLREALGWCLSQNIL